MQTTANTSGRWRRVSTPAGAQWPRSGEPAQAIFRDFSAKGVPVHAEEVGGPAEVSFGLAEDVCDELLLELALRLFEADALGDHVSDQPVQLFFQRHIRRVPSR